MPRYHEAITCESDHKLFSVTEDYNSGVTIVAAVLVSFL